MRWKVKNFVCLHVSHEVQVKQVTNANPAVEVVCSFYLTFLLRYYINFSPYSTNNLDCMYPVLDVPTMYPDGINIGGIDSTPPDTHVRSVMLTGFLPETVINAASPATHITFQQSCCKQNCSLNRNRSIFGASLMIGLYSGHMN